MSQTLTGYRSTIDEIQYPDRTFHCGLDPQNGNHSNLASVGEAASDKAPESLGPRQEESSTGRRKRRHDTTDNNTRCKRRKVQPKIDPPEASTVTFLNPDSSKLPANENLPSTPRENDASTDALIPDSHTLRPLWERIVTEHPALETTRSTPNRSEQPAVIGIAESGNPIVSRALHACSLPEPNSENRGDVGVVKPVQASGVFPAASNCVNDLPRTQHDERSSPADVAASSVETADCSHAVQPSIKQQPLPSAKDAVDPTEQARVFIPSVERENNAGSQETCTEEISLISSNTSVATTTEFTVPGNGTQRVNSTSDFAYSTITGLSATSPPTLSEDMRKDISAEGTSGNHAQSAFTDHLCSGIAHSVQSSWPIKATNLVLPFDKDESDARADSIQANVPTTRRKSKLGRGRRSYVYAPAIPQDRVDENVVSMEQVRKEPNKVTKPTTEKAHGELSDIAESTIVMVDNSSAKVDTGSQNIGRKKARGRRKERCPLIYAPASSSEPVAEEIAEQLSHNSTSLSVNVSTSQSKLPGLTMDASQPVESPLAGVPMEESMEAFTAIAVVRKKQSGNLEDLEKSDSATSGQNLFTVGVALKKKRRCRFKHSRPERKHSTRAVQESVPSQGSLGTENLSSVKDKVDVEPLAINIGSPVITPDMLTLPFDSDTRPDDTIAIDDVTLQFDSDLPPEHEPVQRLSNSKKTPNTLPFDSDTQQEGPDDTIALDDFTLQFDSDLPPEHEPVQRLSNSKKTPKPKKHRGRRSADFQIMNELASESPTTDGSPSQAEYFPLAPPGVRRSGRIRRKSMEIYRATKRQRHTEDELLSQESGSQVESQVESQVAGESGILEEELVVVEDSDKPEPMDCVAISDENSNDVLMDSSVDCTREVLNLHKQSESPDHREPSLQMSPAKAENSSEDKPTSEVDQEDAPKRRVRRNTPVREMPIISASSSPGTRGKKKNEPSLEEIYLNKLWRAQMPKAKTWETIFELPKPGASQYQSMKKSRRNINFDEFYLKNRLKKRRQKALKQGWKPATAKQETKASKLLETKLAALKKELDDLAEDIEDDETLEGVDIDSVHEGNSDGEQQAQMLHISLCSATSSSRQDDNIFYTPTKATADLLNYADIASARNQKMAATFADDISTASTESTCESQTFQTPTKDILDLVL